jgi:hypothetical protein
MGTGNYVAIAVVSLIFAIACFVGAGIMLGIYIKRKRKYNQSFNKLGEKSDETYNTVIEDLGARVDYHVKELKQQDGKRVIKIAHALLDTLYVYNQDEGADTGFIDVKSRKTGKEMRFTVDFTKIRNSFAGTLTLVLPPSFGVGEDLDLHVFLYWKLSGRTFLQEFDIEHLGY